MNNLEDGGKPDKASPEGDAENSEDPEEADAEDEARDQYDNNNGPDTNMSKRSPRTTPNGKVAPYASEYTNTFNDAALENLNVGGGDADSKSGAQEELEDQAKDYIEELMIKQGLSGDKRPETEEDL